MSKYENTTPAFPCELQIAPDSTLKSSWARFSGLSKRELFAAIAMQGMVCYEQPNNIRSIAKEAVEMADALLAALEER